MAKILDRNILGNVNQGKVMDDLEKQDENIDAIFRSNKSQRF